MKEKFLELYFNYIPKLRQTSFDDYLAFIYWNLMSKVPNHVVISNRKTISSLIKCYPEYDLYIPSPKYKFNDEETFKILESNENWVTTVRAVTSPIILMKDAILRFWKDSKTIICYCDSLEIAEKYKDLVVWEVNMDTRLSWLTRDSSGGLLEKRVEYKNDGNKIDVNSLFPDDLPYETITSFLRSENCGLILLHGIPGTGKTTLIKKIISDVSEKDFVMIPGDILDGGINAEDFLEYLFNSKGKKVFIMEDAEKVLLKREKGLDLGTLLNLTDGILGESLETKFICTFNTPLTNIDPALLRKGRLKVRYELGPLPMEKTLKLRPDAKSPMTLADIFNPESNNGEKPKNKIGFNRV